MTSALLLGAPLFAQTGAPPARMLNPEDMGLQEPLEKELAGIVLATLADKCDAGNELQR